MNRKEPSFSLFVIEISTYANLSRNIVVMIVDDFVSVPRCLVYRLDGIVHTYTQTCLEVLILIKMANNSNRVLTPYNIFDIDLVSLSTI